LNSVHSDSERREPSNHIESRSTTGTAAKNFRELIEEGSPDTELPAGQVHKVGVVMIKRCSRLIEEQQGFISPIATYPSNEYGAIPATIDRVTGPIRRLAMVSDQPKASAASVA
jgi:hypothetical protein